MVRGKGALNGPHSKFHACSAGKPEVKPLRIGSRADLLERCIKLRSDYNDLLAKAFSTALEVNQLLDLYDIQQDTPAEVDLQLNSQAKQRAEIQRLTSQGATDLHDQLQKISVDYFSAAEIDRERHFFALQQAGVQGMSAQQLWMPRTRSRPFN
jgi:hypothetical protein